MKRTPFLEKDCLNHEKEFFSEKEFGFCPFVLVRVRKWGFFLRKGFHVMKMNIFTLSKRSLILVLSH